MTMGEPVSVVHKPPQPEVRPGTVLLAVHRDHVVLRDQGYEERLYFPKAEGAETTHATL